MLRLWLCSQAQIENAKNAVSGTNANFCIHTIAQTGNIQYIELLLVEPVWVKLLVWVKCRFRLQRTQQRTHATQRMHANERTNDPPLSQHTTTHSDTTTKQSRAIGRNVTAMTNTANRTRPTHITDVQQERHIHHDCTTNQPLIHH